MCEVGNLLKQTINDGGQADKIGCYMNKTLEANDYVVATVCDGTARIVGLDFPSGGDGGPDHIKFSCTASGGVFTSYSLWACSGGTQNEYISKTIGSDGSVSITSIGNFSDGGGSTGWHSVSASGELSSNNDGSYASKTITSSMRFIGDNNYTGQMTLEQAASSFVLSGFQTGTFSEGSFTNRMYSTGQLIENNTATDFDDYNIQNLAYGDGAASLILSATFGEDTFSMEEVQSWNGDTTEAEASNDYTVAAGAGTVPSVEAVSISFTGDAAYDCLGTEEASLTIPTAIATEDESNVCARFGLNHSWFDCYTETGDNGE
ncbi:MAG: hypothetical protein COV43_00530 [Deltaproteobacteria bacterium CG11_big_fil_rev_8_21_14_0_20_42_23]|nr:MAG: hypothetical protein COV43_00530 [Deltaproteobacteria bacterium CG11_big_fil_rev_8_21_14_0_20_42_23]PJC63854.1 MAG: hypothetical protein CO021_07320 [Deltaproteobacteria bacterium CG_4_9_14_0_2_um_filter_42_21]